MSYARQAVTRLTLDMGLPDVQKSISVTRGDTNRRLEVTLIDKGSPFALPPDWTAALTGVLPGGDELYESCEVADGRIIFDFVAAPAVSSEAGVFGVSFDVFDEGGEVVASPKLWVHVTAGVRRLRDPDTVERLTALQEFVDQIKRVNSELSAHTEQIHDAEEALGTHGERLSGLEDKITVTGHITIPVAEWTDVMPYDAFLSIPGDSFTNGDLLLLAPEDNATKEACARARISVNIDALVDEDPPGMDAVWFLRAESGEIPDSPLHFVYFSIRTGADQDAVAAIIGVDAYGEGGGGTADGVNEEAVRDLIKDVVPSWAREVTAPVTSVNGKTGAVSLTIPSKASDVGADPAGTASSKLITHNVDTASHQDLRLELQRLADRLAAVLDSDDTTLDELSEIVAYIKSNKALIDAITTAKVSVADIIDNLTTNVVNKPLSAAQGVALKTLIDGLQSGKVDKAGVASEVTAQLTAAKQSGEFDGEDGKSAYAYAQDGGYAGTEEEFGEKLAETPLVGLFYEITPSQVAEAVTAGRDVSVTYIDKTYGKVVFSAFIFSEGFSGVFSSEILAYGETYILVELVGSIANGTWTLLTTQIATKDDIPAKLPNPNALTFVEGLGEYVQYDGSAEKTVFLRKAIYVDITTEDGETWKASEKFRNLMNYVTLGYPVYVVLDGVILPLLMHDESNLNFGATLAIGDAFSTSVANIGSDDSVSVEMVDTTSLPNPHALAIGGTTYDGSESVDITDTINGMIDAKLGVIENGSY